MKFFYVLTALGAVIGFFLMLAAVFASSAPAQAAAAAIGVGCAVIPYVFARAVEKISGPR